MITLPVFLSFLLVFTGALGTGSVLSIGDGDTISIKDSINRITVRLACIDAPETSQLPYGMEAREKLWGLLPIGAQVTIKIKATDRYGRTVAEILKGTTNINQALVAAGAAFVYWQYINGCNREIYSRLENEARLKSLGVWAVPGGIQRPWDYRRGRKAGTSGGRYRCKQIGNWARAQELLKQGHIYLDGDGDGQACEGLR